MSGCRICSGKLKLINDFGKNFISRKFFKKKLKGLKNIIYP